MTTITSALILGIFLIGAIIIRISYKKRKSMESDIYTSGGVIFKKSRFIKRISYVCRDKEWYNHPSISIWWQSSKGLGIKGKKKALRYFQIGIQLVGIKVWIDITYIGNRESTKGLCIPEENLPSMLKDNQ